MKRKISCKRLANALSAVIVVVLLINSLGCTNQTTETERGTEQFVVARELAEFSENGVSVKIALETDSKKQPLLRATLIPKTGFHLYSKDLPDRGVNGIGVPTRFLVVEPNTLSPGKPFADVEAKNLDVKALGVTLPIYPEGPVTIRIPIQIPSGAQEVEAKLSFAYMACKTDGVCLRPVDGKEIRVKISSF
jgi:hypothetical protein